MSSSAECGAPLRCPRWARPTLNAVGGWWPPPEQPRRLLARMRTRCGDSLDFFCWLWHSSRSSGSRTGCEASRSMLRFLTVGRGAALAKNYSTYSISSKLYSSVASTVSEEVTPTKASVADALRFRLLPCLCCLRSSTLRPRGTAGSSALCNSTRPALERFGLTGTDFFAITACAETETRCPASPTLHPSQISFASRPSVGFVIAGSA